MPTLDVTQDTFRDNPNTNTAADYLSALMDYESDGMIGDDTFLNGVSDVEQWLRQANPPAAPTTPDERAAALQTSLMLLFKGLENKEIAKAIVGALGVDESINLEVEFTRQLPIAVFVATDKHEIIEYLNDFEEKKFTGTDDQLMLVMQTIKCDTGDLGSIIKDDIVSALDEAGLLAPL
jgi:hypothetical protein